MKATPPMVAAGLVLLAACAGQRSEPEGGPASGIVEVVARGLTFEAPDSVPSGWLTFRLRNASGMTHFALLQRLPDGVGIEDQQRQVAPVFQAGMNLLAAGRAEDAMAKFGELPPWFADLTFLGGPGLTSPGRTSETTVFLEPGTYLIECYVKTGGVFHSFNPDTTGYGMVHEFTVTGAPSALAEPDATLQLTLSSERGIEIAGTAAAGEQTVAVRFESQAPHENFVGHDVHLVRLAEDTDLNAVAAWMDWRLPAGLDTPAPAEFLGGANEMPPGMTAYMKVVLDPGRYAWIAEVPGTEGKGLLRPFEVVGTGESR